MYLVLHILFQLASLLLQTKHFQRIGKMNKANVVTCLAWVPRGKAKSIPDKVELDEEDLQKIIDDTKDEIDNLEHNGDEDEYDNVELEAIKEELNINPTTSTNSQTQSVDEEMKDISSKKVDKFEEEYDLTEYDNEVDLNTMKLGQLVVHADSSKDPYLVGDEDSDAEDDIIHDSDNVIVAGRLEGDSASIEAYVYNADLGYYIHHDFLITSPALCMEWLNYDPRDENLAPGNLVAVGDMTPAINVWDMNCVGSIEPAFTLGYTKKRKKEKSDKAGHTKRVLCLAWNKALDHILASGSLDKTVIIWDLQLGTPAKILTDFTDKVQALKWNPIESHLLLTGCCDQFVRLFDCRSEDVLQKWKVKGEIESLAWDVTDKNIFVASTDRGYVYVIDSRQPVRKYRFKAHETSCTGIAMNSKCPGCLVTVGEDGCLKVWDIKDTEAELVYQTKSLLGTVCAVTASPDDPFVYSFGGDGSQSFKVWDIRYAKQVRQTFCPRLNLPVNIEEEDMSDFESDEEDDDIEEDSRIVQRLKDSLNKNTDINQATNKKKGGRLKKQ